MSKLMCLFASAAVAAVLIGCGGSGDDDGEPRATTPASESPAPAVDSTPAGQSAPAGDPARDLEYVDLQGVAVAPDGSVFAADAGESRVLRVSRRGTVTDFVGKSGLPGLEGDGGPASDARLHGPTGLAVDSAEALYITDHANHRVRKVDPNGTITTVVGSGPEGSASGGFSGDGGAATRARLQEPVAVAVDGSGRIYIADRDNYRVRVVDTAGTITTLAGTGETGPKRIDGPATRAALGLPVGVAAGPAGVVYIADEPAHRIYKVDATGTMTTFAGTGKAGYSGDGGPATDAELNGPYGLATDARGNLYIADLENHVIRVVNRRGTIRTVAGTGANGSGGDGKRATEAALSGPYAVDVDDSGTLYIADTGNARVRRVGRSGTTTTVLP